MSSPVAIYREDGCYQDLSSILDQPPRSAIAANHTTVTCGQMCDLPSTMGLVLRNGGIRCACIPLFGSLMDTSFCSMSVDGLYMGRASAGTIYVYGRDKLAESAQLVTSTSETQLQQAPSTTLVLPSTIQDTTSASSPTFTSLNVPTDPSSTNSSSSERTGPENTVTIAIAAVAGSLILVALSIYLFEVGIKRMRHRREERMHSPLESNNRNTKIRTRPPTPLTITTLPRNFDDLAIQNPLPAPQPCQPASVQASNSGNDRDETLLRDHSTTPRPPPATISQPAFPSSATTAGSYPHQTVDRYTPDTPSRGATLPHTFSPDMYANRSATFQRSYTPDLAPSRPTTPRGLERHQAIPMSASASEQIVAGRRPSTNVSNQGINMRRPSTSHDVIPESAMMHPATPRGRTPDAINHPLTPRSHTPDFSRPTTPRSRTPDEQQYFAPVEQPAGRRPSAPQIMLGAEHYVAPLEHPSRRPSAPQVLEHYNATRRPSAHHAYIVDPHTPRPPTTPRIHTPEPYRPTTPRSHTPETSPPTRPSTPRNNNTTPDTSPLMKPSTPRSRTPERPVIVDMQAPPYHSQQQQPQQPYHPQQSQQQSHLYQQQPQTQQFYHPSNRNSISATPSRRRTESQPQPPTTKNPHDSILSVSTIFPTSSTSTSIPITTNRLDSHQQQPHQETLHQQPPQSAPAPLKPRHRSNTNTEKTRPKLSTLRSKALPAHAPIPFTSLTCKDVTETLTRFGVTPEDVAVIQSHKIDGYRLLLLSDDRLETMGIQSRASRNLIMYIVNRMAVKEMEGELEEVRRVAGGTGGEQEDVDGDEKRKGVVVPPPAYTEVMSAV
ncbi:hypothetical protein HDU97_010032 [Phlyctochytrium planicorne]|nr:hypothetical protein HDU97_010032 [Phlyctochytrium planicorne]